MIGPTSSRAAVDRRLKRPFPGVQMPLDVLHHHDRIVHDESDGEHDRKQCEQVDREAGGEHQERSANQRDRNRHDRNDQRADRAEEQKDHDDDDEQSFSKGREHLVDRVLDVFGRVVGDPDGHSGGQLRLNAGISARTCPITSSELAVGSTQIPMNVAVSPLNRTSSS